MVNTARAAVNFLGRLWSAAQVSRRGKFSLERTLALEEYVQSTSTTRALLVLLCSPLPALLVSIAADAIPLNDPSDGWQANYVAWIRSMILAMALAVLIGIDVRDLIPGQPISNRQIVLLVVGVTVMYMPMAVAVGALWAFPIPFMISVMTVPYSIVYCLMLRWTIGSAGMRRLRTETPGAILRHVNFIQAQGMLPIVYPAFQALFKSVNDTLALPLLVVALPCIKISLKLLMAHCAAHLDDLIPEIVVVTVEMFNAFYLATCIQRITSPTTAAAVIALDVAQNAVALRGIYTRTTRVWRRHRELNGPNWSGNLLTAVRALIVAPRKLDAQALVGIQLRSCIPHGLSDKAIDVLRSLEQGRACFFAPARVRATRHIVPQFATPNQRRSSLGGGVGRPVQAPLPLASVVPASVESPGTSTAAEPPAAVVSPASRRSTHKKSTLLFDSQRVLFTIEYVVLAEYYELISPFFYAGFIACISLFPSAKYHAELEGLEGSAISSTLANNLLFALLKLTSFALLVATLRRISGHDALCHVAFVLETRVVPVQIKMIVWILMVTGFRVVHFGVDFSFRFEWLRSEQRA